MLEARKPEQAKRVLEVVVEEAREHLKRKPEAAAQLIILGRALFYLQRDDEALAAFDKTLKVDSDRAEGHLYRGLIKRYAKDLDAAVSAFRVACKLRPSETRHWVELGRTYSMKEDPKKALAAFSRALKIDAKQPSALHGYGVAQMELGKPDKAIKAFARLAKLQPKNTRAVYNVGQIQQDAGEYKKALKRFLTVVKIDPEDWKARAKIIQLYQALGDLKKRNAARKALFALRKEGRVKSLNSSRYYCREQFRVGENRILVFEYFELFGDMARKYSFPVFDKSGEKKLFTISLGSYDATNAISRELAKAEGEVLKDDLRFYHLDGYFPGGSHATYGFFKGEPGYDGIRARVVEIVKGQLKPKSRFSPGGKSDRAKSKKS